MAGRNRRITDRALFIVTLALIALVGFASVAFAKSNAALVSATPTMTATPSPTDTQQLVATMTPTPTPTRTPTIGAQVTSTRTPTPTPTDTFGGPFTATPTPTVTTTVTSTATPWSYNVVITQVTKTLIGAGGFRISASCPASYFLTGGGADLINADGSPNSGGGSISGSYPVKGQQTWIASASVAGASSPAAGLVAYVICMPMAAA